MTEASRLGAGSLVAVALVGFLGALVGSVVGTLLVLEIISPVQQAASAVSEGRELIKELPRVEIPAVHRPASSDRSDDPVEAVRYFLDNVRAGRLEHMVRMVNSQAPLDTVRDFLTKHPLPQRETALERSAIKEIPAIDEKHRVFSWTTESTSGQRIEFRLVLVNISARTDNPFWWLVERVDCTTPGSEPAKK
jgi:hypothetical protein